MQQFLNSYAESAASGRVAEVVSHFADTFMVPGPQGAQCVRATDFASVLPKRYELFEKLGCRSTELLSATEIRLDGRYVLARTRWRMTFEGRDSRTVDVEADSDYVIDTGLEPWKIVFYLANQDLMAVLKQRGIALE
jgi:hypothetical protein